MKPTEYTIAYENKEGITDIVYNLQTKKDALKEARQLKKQGATSIWIDIHIEDDIVGDIKVL